MNDKTVNFIKNFSYTLTSNLVSLIVSTLVILIVPKLIGVEEYGYWQIYLFYSSYVGFMHFGWNDGIYLRYGGEKYKEIDKGLFFSQFCMLVVLQLTISGLLLLSSTLIGFDINKTFVIEMVSICLVIVNIRLMLLYILQATNRIKEYSQITMMDRILYCTLIIVFLIFGVRQYKLLIVADLIGKLLSLLYAMYCCRDIVFRKFSLFQFSFQETKLNINVGMKLMFSNIASMLIIGVVRFGIERTWTVSTFGVVSLTLSISNLMMLFINAVGIIMFPILRRTNEKKLPSIYVSMRNFLMVILLGLITLYYPIRAILSGWLPKYSDSLAYMALVFPMCVYEGKMALLINTYLKTLRKEKLMLKINLISLVLGVIITFFTTVLYKNLDSAIVSIVFLLALRCVLAEIFLSKILRLSLYKDIVLELIMSFIFIITGWYLNSWIALVLYLVVYVIYLVIKRKDIVKTLENFKYLMKN
ncbi:MULTISPECIES: hypothetical protein [unclassified Paenibacillus]|uniref:hypothetical protein n=1 Tax=unclassified Paenibacillus TaxID=185978 RepID=UPI0024735165|nr:MULTISPECIES: hypothetical protein [unclassified Paenibacillus]MDH6431133.1 O-antigen/teichoic acid export membrane protein [Paenibacillus sp. PastH-4]MDH6447212.1 O-antigen/teichoic acid export membrane protein [Paenibacillus sp. PastF-4]MDH6531346.1 O-antigen/teichoic acid export membrane protein [Paenibacillus sp. PastH-3]